MATNTTPPAENPAFDLADLPDDPNELTAEQRAVAAGLVLHEVVRLVYALQTACETLAFIAGVPESDLRQIERAAIEEEGQAMDDAAGLA